MLSEFAYLACFAVCPVFFGCFPGFYRDFAPTSLGSGCGRGSCPVSHGGFGNKIEAKFGLD